MAETSAVAPPAASPEATSSTGSFEVVNAGANAQVDVAPSREEDTVPQPFVAEPTAVETAAEMEAELARRKADAMKIVNIFEQGDVVEDGDYADEEWGDEEAWDEDDSEDEASESVAAHPAAVPSGFASYDQSPACNGGAAVTQDYYHTPGFVTLKNGAKSFLPAPPMGPAQFATYQQYRTAAAPPTAMQRLEELWKFHMSVWSEEA